jgi:cysteine sulfinate desulfinase/cysteine desulfurase-like protein
VKPIHLDYNASTPIAPEVADAMRPFLSEHYGNPSSQHWAGVSAKQAVEKARSQVAALLGCAPQAIVFTSGGTEANNHAIKARSSPCANAAVTSSRLRSNIRRHCNRADSWSGLALK